MEEYKTKRLKLKVDQKFFGAERGQEYISSFLLFAKSTDFPRNFHFLPGLYVYANADKTFKKLLIIVQNEI